MNTDIIFFTYFLENALLLLDHNVDKNVNNSQIAKVQRLRVLLGVCIIFRKFQPGIAYKKSVYIKYHWYN